MGNELTVVVPNRNGSRTLGDVLGAVVSQCPPGTEVLLVDDASTDDSVSLVQAQHPEVVVLRSDTNRGAAATRNRGLSSARGTWVLFVDSDVVVQSECLAVLLSLREKADIVYPTIRYPNGLVMYPLTCADAKYLTISPIFLVRREALERLQPGPFDETYGTYCEDTDFFLRCYLAGLQARHASGAEAIHDVKPNRQNRENRFYLEVRNSLYGMVKFLGAPGIGTLDHAFKVNNILKVIGCGLINYNLFDMQARGLERPRGLGDGLRAVLRGGERIADRSGLVPVRLIAKAFAWNALNLPRAREARRSLRLSLR